LSKPIFSLDLIIYILVSQISLGSTCEGKQIVYKFTTECISISYISISMF